MCCFVYFHTYGVGIGMPHISSNMRKIEHFAAFTAKQQESCQMINFTQIRRNVRHPITTYKHEEGGSKAWKMAKLEK